MYLYNTDRKIHKTGLLNLVALILATLAIQALAKYCGGATAQIVVAFMAIGVLETIVSLFQMRLYAREAIEQIEFMELQKSKDSSALFTSSDSEVFIAKHAREQFEKYFVPAFTVILFLIAGAAAWRLWLWLPKAPTLEYERLTISMALTALFALILFLLGKYSLELAKLENQRLLNPSASFLMLGSVAFALIAVVEAAAWFGFPKIDQIAARILVIILFAVAAEILINLILEFYRPRVKGQITRLLYESRIVGIIGQPASIVSTAAQALDYQFGFKVSETWFYKFIQKTILWFILAQAAALFVSSMIVIIEPNEQGLLERFGKPVNNRNILNPGIHIKFPWPIDKVYRYPTKSVQTFYVGFIPSEDSDDSKTIVWTKPHYKEEFNFIVATKEKLQLTTDAGETSENIVPVNLFNANIPIQFKITDIQKWAYNHADASNILVQTANREVIKYLLNVDSDDLISSRRLEAAENIRRNIQATADSYNLGVEILFVGLQSVHPPVKIADAYEAVIGAMQEKETNILAAMAYKAQKIPLAVAEATNIIAAEDSKAFAKIITAKSESQLFKSQITAFKAAPSIYKMWSFLDTFVESGAKARKYVITTTNAYEIFWLNLEEKLRPDLLDVAVPETKK
jgi:regulator of protease activity HflC (stomatin/prohibitin superfamily)